MQLFNVTVLLQRENKLVKTKTNHVMYVRIAPVSRFLTQNINK